MMTSENYNLDQNILDDGPKIGFLDAFHGILLFPKKTFDDLYEEDTFTIFVYGALAMLLSNLGKLKPVEVSILNLIGVEIAGIFSWFSIGLFIFFFSTVFKTPNNNLGRLLGFIGLSNIPFLLLTPFVLAGNFFPWIYNPFIYAIVNIWTFILFWIALAKCFQLEAWRVLLMAIIPFILGIFLFTYLIAIIFGLALSSSFSLFR